MGFRDISAIILKESEIKLKRRRNIENMLSFDEVVLISKWFLNEVILYLVSH